MSARPIILGGHHVSTYRTLFGYALLCQALRLSAGGSFAKIAQSNSSEAGRSFQHRPSGRMGAFSGAPIRGLTIFAADGHFSGHVMRSDRAKAASNNRIQGTPDENKATAQGTISSFGTYTVDEAKKTYTLRIEGSSYPNWEGTEITRPVTITGDELTVTNPTPSVGGPPSQLVFRRVK